MEDAFHNFSEELQVSSYEENVCNTSGEDLTSLIGLVNQVTEMGQQRAGVLITEGMSVAVLTFRSGQVAIVDSHQHDQNGALICFARSADDLFQWYKHSFQKYYHRSLGNACTLTWLTFAFN